MTCLFTNGGVGRLAEEIIGSTTTIVLQNGEGNRFPQPTAADDYFMVTVYDLDGSMEIMKCVTRNGDSLIVQRAQEGTTARAFGVQAYVTNQFTAGAYKAMVDAIAAASAKSNIPVGFIYVQYSGQDAPATIFGGTWSNVSSSYAGRFFRAEGGSAAAYGSVQAGGLPNLSGSVDAGRCFATNTANGYPLYLARGSTANDWSGSGSGNSNTACVIGFDASKANALYGAATEVRPINSTIRVWKKTA